MDWILRNVLLLEPSEGASEQPHTQENIAVSERQSDVDISRTNYLSDRFVCTISFSNMRSMFIVKFGLDPDSIMLCDDNENVVKVLKIELMTEVIIISNKKMDVTFTSEAKVVKFLMEFESTKKLARFSSFLYRNKGIKFENRSRATVRKREDQRTKEVTEIGITGEGIVGTYIFVNQAPGDVSGLKWCFSNTRGNVVDQNFVDDCTVSGIPKLRLSTLASGLTIRAYFTVMKNSYKIDVGPVVLGAEDSLDLAQLIVKGRVDFRVSLRVASMITLLNATQCVDAKNIVKQLPHETSEHMYSTNLVVDNEYMLIALHGRERSPLRFSYDEFLIEMPVPVVNRQLVPFDNRVTYMTMLLKNGIEEFPIDIHMDSNHDLCMAFHKILLLQLTDIAQSHIQDLDKDIVTRYPGRIQKLLYKLYCGYSVYDRYMSLPIPKTLVFDVTINKNDDVGPNGKASRNKDGMRDKLAESFKFSRKAKDHEAGNTGGVIERAINKLKPAKTREIAASAGLTVKAPDTTIRKSWDSESEDESSE